MILFNQRLKELRKEKKLSQADLGKMLRITVSGYGRYELGISQPDIQSIITLAKFYNVSIDYLVGVSPNRNSDSLLVMFNKLSEADKYHIIGLMERLGKLNEKEHI